MLPVLPDFDPQPPWKKLWPIQPGVHYLNHGSFGPTPQPIQAVQQNLLSEIEKQPAEFFFRKREDHLHYVTSRMAQYLGTKPDNLLLVNNATVAMNLVARNIELQPGEEVLLTNHEYGAVQNIWRDVCQTHKAVFGMAELPLPMSDIDEVVDSLFARVTDKTRLIVVSHVTSPTSIILPVKQICQRARQLGIPVCIDGPHALLMHPLQLKELGCQFYTASCHKWFSAPFGTGFLFVRGEAKSKLKPLMTSWGRSLNGNPKHWKDAFLWQGTDNDSALLTLPATLDFWNRVGEETFRQYSFELAQYARTKISPLFPFSPLAPATPDWSGSMVSIPIGKAPTTDKHIGKPDPLQARLLEEFQIEVPVIQWNGLKLLRVSTHLYNDRTEIDLLADSLSECIPS